MKRPIDPSEIVGRSVTIPGGRPARLVAYIDQPAYLLECEDGSRWVRQPEDFELIPLPVDLPSVPTLGVLEWTSGPNTASPGTTRRMFAEWYPSVCVSTFAHGTTPTQMHATGTGLQVPMSAVTAFTPATAVPTEALDRLMAGHDQVHAGREFCNPSDDSVCNLAAALDAANGGAA